MNKVKDLSFERKEYDTIGIIIIALIIIIGQIYLIYQGIKNQKEYERKQILYDTLLKDAETCLNECNDVYCVNWCSLKYTQKINEIYTNGTYNNSKLSNIK